MSPPWSFNPCTSDIHNTKLRLQYSTHIFEWNREFRLLSFSLLLPNLALGS